MNIVFVNKFILPNVMMNQKGEQKKQKDKKQKIKKKYFLRRSLARKPYLNKEKHIRRFNSKG